MAADDVDFILRRYPFLRERLPVMCNCGAVLVPAYAYQCEITVGIRFAPCSKCGAPEAQLGTYRSTKRAAKIIDAIKKFLGEDA